MPSDEPARCSSCGAEILWAHTEKGNMIPLNAKPERRFVLDHTGDDGVLVAHLAVTYQTHFATCPNASQHRK